jgi:hypothetical protein
MHIGTIFHVVALLDLPDFHQQATRSSTLLGMTQEIPKQEKMLFHRAEATSQVEEYGPLIPHLACMTASIYNDYMHLPEIAQSKDST